MLPAILELVADKADAVEVGAHREFLVLGLVLPATRAFLRQRLVVERQGQDNVAPYLAGVELAVEAPQLDRAVAVEEAMQVQEVM